MHKVCNQPIRQQTRSLQRRAALIYSTIVHGIILQMTDC